MSLAERNGTTMSEAVERGLVTREAASHVGTAFHHRGRIWATKDADGKILDKGGIDCAQSVYFIYRAALSERLPEVVEADAPYIFQWNLSEATARDESYLQTVLKYAREIKREESQPGDLALFRVARAWAHGAIIMPPGFPSIAHANTDAHVFMIDRVESGRLARRPVRFFTLW